MHTDYRRWLEQQYPQKTVSTKMSEVKRVEDCYGDLDDQFEKDGFRSVLESLRYGPDDRSHNRPNPSKIPIEGDYYSCLASYRTAVTNYRRFLEQLDQTSGAEDLPAVSAVEAPLLLDREDEGMRLGLKKDMQSALRKDIEQLEPGLRIIDTGAERRVASGFIDIMAIDRSDANVVVELKVGKATRDAIAQIQSYMGDLVVAEPNKEVRGILVASEFDTKAIAAARVVPSLKLRRYSVRFSFCDP